jgi:hypothetical protein
MSRLPQSESVDPEDWVIKLDDKLIPFAGPNHPGWRLFLERLNREHNIYTRSMKSGETWPEEKRKPLIEVAFEKLINEPENGMNPGTIDYLRSIDGIVEVFTEGVWLANPSESRETIKTFVESWTIPMLRSFKYGPRSQLDAAD